MGRSLYTKLVLIIMTLIVAFMVVVGAFLLHGVRSFYLNQFYEGMQTVFANEELADSLRAAADSDQAVEGISEILKANIGRLGIDSGSRNYYILDGKTGEYLTGSNNPEGGIVNTANILTAMTGASGYKSDAAADFMDVAIPLSGEGGSYIIYIIDNKATVQSLNGDLSRIILQAMAIGLGISGLMSLLLEKTLVTPNGVSVERLLNLPGKTEEDEGKINIGAVLRVTPIKDVKTMIQAFSFAKEREPRLKLWIMGPCDEDAQYAGECREQVEAMGLTDVVFTGRIDIRDYLGRMDMTILTSISEGQPLTILEGYAAHKPVIATDVGNCSGLIFGENDDYGAAGILTHIMNVDEIAQAMIDMARNEPMRLQMGESGYQRVMSGYRIEHMRETYHKIYQDFAGSMGLSLEEERTE